MDLRESEFLEYIEEQFTSKASHSVFQLEVWDNCFLYNSCSTAWINYFASYRPPSPRGIKGGGINLTKRIKDDVDMGKPENKFGIK